MMWQDTNHLNVFHDVHILRYRLRRVHCVWMAEIEMESGQRLHGLVPREWN